MPMLLAVMNPEAAIPAFLMITLVFLGLCFLITPRVMSGRLESKFILLGLLSVVAAIGYATMVEGGMGATVRAPGGEVAAQVGVAGAASYLLRLGVILVLAGVAVSLLSCLSAKSTPEQSDA